MHYPTNHHPCSTSDFTLRISLTVAKPGVHVPGRVDRRSERLLLLSQCVERCLSQTLSVPRPFSPSACMDTATAHNTVIYKCYKRTCGLLNDPRTQLQDWMLGIPRRKALFRSASLVLGSSVSIPRTPLRGLSKDAFSSRDFLETRTVPPLDLVAFCLLHCVIASVSRVGSRSTACFVARSELVPPSHFSKPFETGPRDGSSRPILQSKVPFCPMKGSGLFPFVSNKGSIRST